MHEMHEGPNQIHTWLVINYDDKNETTANNAIMNLYFRHQLIQDWKLQFNHSLMGLDQDWMNWKSIYLF